MERNEIEEARRKQGMTYQELADKTGISVSTVHRYCSNEVKSPSVEVTNALKKSTGAMFRGRNGNARRTSR